MSGINWREAMAWQMPADDRELIDGLRQKAARGQELDDGEVRQAEAIIRRARRGVHGAAGERALTRDLTVDELFAELDKIK